MPVHVNVGLSRKVGEPNYGSRGASVNLEAELEYALLAEPDKLKDRIRQLFNMLRSALTEELHGRRTTAADSAKPSRSVAPSAPAPTAAASAEPSAVIAPVEGESSDQGSTAGTDNQPASSQSADGQPANGQPGRPATRNQVLALQARAQRHGIDLLQLLEEHFGVASPEELSVKEASQLLDHLNRQE